MLRSRLLAAGGGDFAWLMASSNGKFAHGGDALSWSTGDTPAVGNAGTWLAGICRSPAGVLVTAINGNSANGHQLGTSGAGALHRSTDGGDTWTQVHSSAKGLVVTYIRGAFFAKDTNDTDYSSGYGNNIWRSVDGTTWTLVANANGSSSTRNWIAEGAGKLVIAAGSQNNQISNPPRVSTDDGMTWHNAASAIVLGEFSCSHEVGYAAGNFLSNILRSNDGASGGLYRSADGETWAGTATSGYVSRHVAGAHDHHYVGIGGTCYYSADGGANLITTGLALVAPQVAWQGGKYLLADESALNAYPAPVSYYTSTNGTSFTENPLPTDFIDIANIFTG